MHEKTSMCAGALTFDIILDILRRSIHTFLSKCTLHFCVSSDIAETINCCSVTIQSFIHTDLIYRSGISAYAAPFLASRNIPLSTIRSSFGGLAVYTWWIIPLILSHSASVSSYLFGAIGSASRFLLF